MPTTSTKPNTTTRTLCINDHYLGQLAADKLQAAQSILDRYQHKLNTALGNVPSTKYCIELETMYYIEDQHTHYIRARVGPNSGVGRSLGTIFPQSPDTLMAHAWLANSPNSPMVPAYTLYQAVLLMCKLHTRELVLGCSETT